MPEVKPHHALLIFICAALLICAFIKDIFAYEAECAFVEGDNIVHSVKHYIELKDFASARQALEKAIKVSEEVVEPVSKHILLYEVIDKFIKLGELERASSVAEQLTFQDVKDQVFLSIAREYIKLNELKKGAEAVKSICDDFVKALAIYRIVNIITGRGLFDQALAVARDLQDSPEISKNLCLVQTLADKKLLWVGDEKQALSPKGSNSSARVYGTCRALFNLTEKYFILNLYVPANNILSLAEELSGRIDSESLRLDILYNIKQWKERIKKQKKSSDYFILRQH